MNDSSKKGTKWPSTLATCAVVGLAGVVLTGVFTQILFNQLLVHMGPGEDALPLAEVSAMDAAFKAYKERFGSYPPSDFTKLGDPESPQYKELARHLATSFPRCNPKSEIAAIKKLGVRSPAQALCFWLEGFGRDPAHPVTGWIDATDAKSGAFFPFDPARLKHPAGENSCPVYLPPGSDAPYVFFSSVSYATQAPFNSEFKQGGKGNANPYRADKIGDGEFMNPKSFQIINAGADGDYGSGMGSFPSGAGYSAGDKDNITNFSFGALGDAIAN